MGVKVVVMFTSGECSSGAMVAEGLKRLCKQAGADYHSPLKLRHGHTVYALKKAQDIADLKAVSQNLRHASLTITDRAYGMRSGQDMAKAIVGLCKTVETAGQEGSVKQLEALLE